MTDFRFDLQATDGAARTGVITTPRGGIRTPAFMPVGTAGTVKAMHPQHVRETGADIVLGNTYHLMLRPTAERVRQLGGLHRFMNWERPILTDSGGFQVMSLSKLRKLTENGVTFQSHIDGSRHELTPERSIEIQCLLGSDIQMQFDECPPFPISEEGSRESMELSLRWAVRSKQAFEEKSAPGNALFGIVQGSVFEDQRRRSLDELLEIGFDGYSVGGLAVGEGQEEMFRVLDFTTPHMDTARPRYLMGVGKPSDLVGAVARGIDMFDCVAPTRSGRHGQAWTRNGPINIKNARFIDDETPLDPDSPCPASSQFSKAYLNHLFKAGEYLGPMLLTWHNLNYYQELMAAMRGAIAEGRFEHFVAHFEAAQGAQT
ncbi:tRNA guanosine(34) transglycosylase Tgt [Aquisalinus flavus]|uniref:Queuine tRNA-ribosyltransferase n=1 Tax=Aquisalinus flavus TaxID=1526572 RepID=A0A8J2Y7I8_9PROT|nr:tRNA guanosine(34) transglycosylase Tgt [Aquisalinus flavus]MBD0427593.1 tRNA guanosine(34) transglycosylase Tgt [Aquisalinus flavus]UNE47383.1 tRNA guanosine(34) transglycosylase Tgt [Aquisalinus flavus]GGD02226.1 queuine tRNA-ribosyltransferase [Aquisalinus flavus]